MFAHSLHDFEMAVRAFAYCAGSDGLRRRIRYDMVPQALLLLFCHRARASMIYIYEDAAGPCPDLRLLVKRTQCCATAYWPASFCMVRWPIVVGPLVVFLTPPHTGSSSARPARVAIPNPCCILCIVMDIYFIRFVHTLCCPVFHSVRRSSCILIP